MNTAPIETARDPDLRLSLAAMQRAALRAHELARQTATELVISRNGVVELLSADQLPATSVAAREASTPYRNA